MSIDAACVVTPNVEVTGAKRLYRAASGGMMGWARGSNTLSCGGLYDDRKRRITNGTAAVMPIAGSPIPRKQNTLQKSTPGKTKKAATAYVHAATNENTRKNTIFIF
ncbi:hypothetical protein [Limnohabitans sp.]|uniref:hypothetical protein n=1 Tax=Limnohabitans sp. TaxID=1907725 RepID=UPI0037BF61B5